MHLKSVTKIKTQIYRNFFEATSLGVLTRTDLRTLILRLGV